MPDANGAKLSEMEMPEHGSLSAVGDIYMSCGLSQMQQSKHPFADRDVHLSLGLRRNPSKLTLALNYFVVEFSGGVGGSQACQATCTQHAQVDLSFLAIL